MLGSGSSTRLTCNYNMRAAPLPGLPVSDHAYPQNSLLEYGHMHARIYIHALVLRDILSRKSLRNEMGVAIKPLVQSFLDDGLLGPTSPKLVRAKRGAGSRGKLEVHGARSSR